MGDERFIAAMLCAWVFGGCGANAGAPEDDVQRSRSAEPVDVVDPLLERAQQQIESGVRDDALIAALRAMDAPAHQRAARILAVLDPAQRDSSRVGAARPSPPAAASRGTGDRFEPSVRKAPLAARVESARRRRAAPPSSDDDAGEVEASAAPKGQRVVLERLHWRERNGAIELNLGANRSLVVGVAHQPQQGLVRLVVEGKGTASVLRARPRARGARVTQVRDVGASVFITIALEPGWSLEGVDPTGHGAKVRVVSQGP